MNRFLPFLVAGDQKIRQLAPYAILALLALALLIPQVALAQGNQAVIDANDAANAMMRVFRPIFRILQFVIVITAFVLAIIKAFQASQGKGANWIQVGMLILVAVFIAVPDTIIAMFGMQTLSECVEVLTSNADASQCRLIRNP